MAAYDRGEMYMWVSAVTLLFGIGLGIAIWSLATEDKLTELEQLKTHHVVCPMCEGRGVVELPEKKEERK